MPKTTPSKKRKAAAKTPGAIAEVRLYAPSKKQISVKQLDQPPTIERPKKIHPRHLLPLVREGEERNVHSVSKEAIIRPHALAPMAASDEVTLVKNTELTAPGKQKTASNVGEPSVAINGDVVFYTGNWYAAVSSDGGTTFKFIDPGTQFPDPAPNAQFCCDQIVHYISKIDTFVWLLQYGPEDGDNIQRLAFAKTADVVKGKWRLFDITTKILKVQGAFLDFPDLSVGANNLYVTTNIFAPGNKVGSAVIRIPFSGIESGQVTAQPFVSMSLQSFRVAQNCGTTAFFAAHQNTSTLAVFSWKEGQSAPVQKLVPVARWIGGNGYISRLPDGRRWLDRADPRITGATMVKKELWFAWTVDRRSNQRAQPFVQIARIDSTNVTLLENINIFDPTSAIAYGALSTNSNDEVGVSYMIGGAFPPSHVVGVLTGTRKNVISAKGERGPLDAEGNGEWGDYLTVRRVFPSQKLFAATGYTMKGKGDGSNRDVTPRFVVFGRAGDAKASGVTPPAPGPAPGPAPEPTPGPEPTPAPAPVVGGVVGAPFKDVNALPTVSAAVAAQIKAAAIAEGQPDFPETAAVGVGLKLVTKPGVERWPVKTGTDDDIAFVGKNIINGMSLGAGIVEATVEELIRIPRPPDMRPVNKLFPHFQERRRGPVEFVVWRVEGDIIAIKQEADGDLHLVLQGASGETMIAEVPTPRPPFVDASCPWTSNLEVARKAIDDKIVKKLLPANFVLMDDTLVPRESLPPSLHPQAMAMTPLVAQSFVTPQADSAAPVPTFKAKLKPIACRITGVGFFDKVHGQMGVSQLNGIELHPGLKIEFL